MLAPSDSNPPALVLDTERLALRRMSSGDAPFILRLLNEPSFIEFIGDKGVRDLDGARDYIATGPVASYERFGFGLYLVTLKSSGEPIGMCGLLKRDALEDVDIGFAYLPAYWSQGYAAEAALAVKTYARDVLGLERIVAIALPSNTRSIRMLDRIGFSFERTVRVAANEPELSLLAASLSR